MPTPNAPQRPLAITAGDPAGIGPEIIVKAYLQAPEDLANSFVVGDVGVMRRAARVIAGPAGIAPPVLVLDSAAEAASVPPRCIPVLQVGPPAPELAYGQVQAEAGRLAASWIVWAARAALRGEVAGIVTAPVHKEALAAAGVPYPGHTEMLQAEAAAWAGRPLAEMPVRMMLANDELRVVLLSIHVSLREAIARVTGPNIEQTLQIADTALRAMLGRSPRLAVAGLNPHAGEGGRFGREELDIIAPAVAAARARGLDVHGPYAPDTVFMRARQGAFDAVIAMYHDQGLIPVKYLGLDQGVNVTLGLPLVRTSPDHGTAFDLAGSGQADPRSLIAAVRQARVLGQR
ncbi:4-hydroxythreonine-4-phosphate dehydrogenase PdxA [Tibeticola sp.]|uniref:4-hydroxythreonine-4-phosphate dehydrogenase PdxA n=1 Tax=Tibeticola sp. TaxID=2005368 RepID=UPI00258B3CDA|nr:4-hydroxythreonine-4-phosphate dehydrogenase PdxA [Tibeticola sp.]MCI4440821.1 4-hydroxythreonine-4-phosphate dehydrogenase PdxA [Tibeticola sp.]